MSSTGATVLWPTKLKIGATSRKDPNVKIIGTPSAVTAAKDRILRELDTKVSSICVGGCPCCVCVCVCLLIVCSVHLYVFTYVLVYVCGTVAISLLFLFLRALKCNVLNPS